MAYQYQVTLNRNQLFPVATPPDTEIDHGQLVLVETEDGIEAGKVTRIPQLAQLAWEREEAPQAVKFLRIVSPTDRDALADKKIKELQALQQCKTLVEKYRLPMRLVSTYYTFDFKKLTLYYTSPQRVDFRELLKEMTQVFRRVRINLRHIGARDEAAMYGGAGPCGKELCCSTWLRDFKPVNITLARDQNLPMNPQKVTGNCGRLMCCLNYEYETYLDAAKRLPNLGTGVSTPEGKGRISGLHFIKEEFTVKLENGETEVFKASQVEILPDDVAVNVVFEAPTAFKEEKAQLEAMSKILNE